jgi:purine nucleosidase
MRLIIDCDPGIDDAVALLLAIASPELEILGITTVAGNVPVSVTQRNARQICELAGRSDLAVYAGCPRPLVRSPIFAADAHGNNVHGNNGLGGVLLPEPTMALQPSHGVSFLIKTLRMMSEPVTVAALGPLTNLAVALVQAPEIAQKIDRLVIMGGASGAGNITPSAEFNMFADPHAAHVVFGSGIPIVLLPLDVTHQAIATPTRLQQLVDRYSPARRVVLEMLGRYSLVEQARMGWAGPPLHDPGVIAYLLKPQLFEVVRGTIAIETGSALTLGRTVIDWVAPDLIAKVSSEREQWPIEVITAVDADGFYRLLSDRL